MQHAKKHLCAAIAFVALACSGGGTGPTPPPPPPPPPAPTATLSASPLTLSLGQSTTFSWSCGNTVSALSSWTGSLPSVSGASQFTPSQAGTFPHNVSCKNSAGVTATASVTITVVEQPQIKVQVYGAHPSGYGPTTNLKVVLSSGAWKDSTNLSPSGFGGITPPSSVQGGSVVCYSVKETVGNFYKDSNACLPASSALAGAKVFVLVPEIWNIVSGSFAGQMVNINLGKATAQGCDGLGFYLLLSNAPIIRNELPLAFDRSASDVEITPTDSTAWWSRINALKERTGFSWFRPATMDEVTSVNGVRFIVNPQETGANIGVAGAGGTSAQGITNGFVAYRSKEWLNSTPHLLLHELGHVAGFGHTAQANWASIMNTFACQAPPIAGDPSVEDVAYIQLWYKVKEIAFDKSAHFDITSAVAGEQGTFPGITQPGLVVDFFTIVD